MTFTAATEALQEQIQATTNKFDQLQQHSGVGYGHPGFACSLAVYTPYAAIVANSTESPKRSSHTHISYTHETAKLEMQTAASNPTMYCAC